MEIEIFDNNNPTGQILLLQIKSISKIFSKNNESYYSFTIETKTLKYAERFITPFILVVCPVNANPLKSFYIWLQDYIKTYLDIDKSKWRNQKTITLHIPENNEMPGNEKHLSFISKFPIRLYSLSEIGKISHELSFLEQGCENNLKNYTELIGRFENIVNLTKNTDWPKSNFLLDNYIIPAIRACKCIGYCDKLSKSDLNFFKVKQGWIDKKEYYEYSLRNIIHNAIDKLHFYFEETNYDLKNFVWKEYNAHDF